MYASFVGLRENYRVNRGDLLSPKRMNGAELLLDGGETHRANNILHLWIAGYNLERSCR